MWNCIGNKCTYILSKPLNDASINAIDFANELILVTNNCSAEFGCGHHFLQVYISPLEVRSTKQSLALEIGVNSFGNDVDQGFSIKRLLNNVSNAF